MAVDRGDIDPIRPQRRDHRVHFIARKHEIASNCGLAAAGRLEVDRGGYAHRTHRRNLHAAFHDRVAAWHSKLINAAVRLALAAAGRLEVDRGGYAHRTHRRNLHAAFHDRVAAWHSKLINAAVRLALAA